MDQDNPNNPSGGSGSDYGSGSNNFGSTGTGSSAGSATGSGSTGGSTSASGSFGDLGSTGGGMASGGGSGATSGMGSGGSTGSLGSMGENFGSASGGTGTEGSGGGGDDDNMCPTCGQQKDRGGMGQFLGRLGITDEMVSNMKSSWDNVDIDEYLNTARDYLKDGSSKATRFAKENPGKVAAGVAVLALGAGLLYNATRDKGGVEVEFTPDYDRDRDNDRVVMTEQSGGGDRLRTDRAVNDIDRDNGPNRR